MHPTDSGELNPWAFFIGGLIKTAILIDGGFYRKRASKLWGHKTPEARADELYNYCILKCENSIKKRKN